MLAPSPITKASPRTRKRSARLRRKEGGDVGAVLQQLGDPVVRPLVPKASPPLRGRTTGNKAFPYTNRENGWRCRLKGRCPSAAPKDWRSAWNQADPGGGPAAHFDPWSGGGRGRFAAPATASSQSCPGRVVALSGRPARFARQPATEAPPPTPEITCPHGGFGVGAFLAGRLAGWPPRQRSPDPSRAALTLHLGDLHPQGKGGPLTPRPVPPASHLSWHFGRGVKGAALRAPLASLGALDTPPSASCEWDCRRAESEG